MSEETKDVRTIHYTHANGEESEEQVEVCAACGHLHWPAYGGICVGCLCEERPKAVHAKGGR